MGRPDSFLQHQGIHFSLEAASMPFFYPLWKLNSKALPGPQDVPEVPWTRCSMTQVTG